MRLSVYESSQTPSFLTCILEFVLAVYDHSFWLYLGFSRPPLPSYLFAFLANSNMSPTHKSAKTRSGTGSNGPSKAMNPLPESFGPIFIQNQFRTTIDLPTQAMYPHVSGQCAIVTGSNTGLGLEASRQLLSLGLSHLVMAVRSVSKGEAAAKPLRASYPSAVIDVWSLDMESYDSILSFVDKCNKNLSRIDICILNAGLGSAKFEICTATGHDKMVQVNHISTALLAILLIPVLKAKSKDRSSPARLTVVNSITAQLTKLPNKDTRPFLASFDDLAITPFDASERYGASKLVSQLFLVKLADLVNADDVVINMVDPGLTKGTGLARDIKGATAIVAKIFFGIAGRPVDRGAATYIHAVLGLGKESHGCFLMNAQIAP